MGSVASAPRLDGQRHRVGTPYDGTHREERNSRLTTTATQIPAQDRCRELTIAYLARRQRRRTTVPLQHQAHTARHPAHAMLMSNLGRSGQFHPEDLKSLAGAAQRPQEEPEPPRRLATRKVSRRRTVTPSISRLSQVVASSAAPSRPDSPLLFKKFSNRGPGRHHREYWPANSSHRKASSLLGQAQSRSYR